jgi:hypothetical protein
MFCALLTDAALDALTSKRPKTAVCAVLLIVWLVHGLDGFPQQINAENWSMAFLLQLIAALNVESFDTPEPSPHSLMPVVLLVPRL